ncbi:hypothetical protein K7W42_18865 [Deinococcus sp. HMF7604]|uniref:hypothetical protein n=1 Tax=Deinococcus betulae TaxID=2873312 RepID=UPI001CCA3BA4|nr:hypothetical protein [Deinococcus betulae]MBZ9752905.1 hypothetical protein [Deinococcus betulae]
MSVRSERVRHALEMFHAAGQQMPIHTDGSVDWLSLGLWIGNEPDIFQRYSKLKTLVFAKMAEHLRGPANPTLTYEILLTSGAQTALSDSSLAVYRSTMRTYLRTSGTSLQNSVSTELLDYRHALSRAILIEMQVQQPKCNLKSLRSILRWWRKQALTLLFQSHSQAQPFQTLLLILNECGFTSDELDCNLHLDVGTIRTILTQPCFAPQTSELIQQIESLLDLPKGLLISSPGQDFSEATVSWPEDFCQVSRPGIVKRRQRVLDLLPYHFEDLSESEREEAFQTALTKVRDDSDLTQNQLRRRRYYRTMLLKAIEGLSSPWEEEIEQLVQFKTEDVLLDIDMHRNNKWSEATVEIRIRGVKTFIAFLHLSRSQQPDLSGLGIDAHFLTLLYY